MHFLLESKHTKVPFFKTNASSKLQLRPNRNCRWRCRDFWPTEYIYPTYVRILYILLSKLSKTYKRFFKAKETVTVKSTYWQSPMHFSCFVAKGITEFTKMRNSSLPPWHWHRHTTISKGLRILTVYLVYIGSSFRYMTMTLVSYFTDALARHWNLYFTWWSLSKFQGFYFLPQFFFFFNTCTAFVYIFCKTEIIW